jgi:hypothetical protein
MFSACETSEETVGVQHDSPASADVLTIVEKHELSCATMGVKVGLDASVHDRFAPPDPRAATRESFPYSTHDASRHPI